MSYSGPVTFPDANALTPFSPESIMYDLMCGGEFQFSNSMTWTANRAVYIPFSLSRPRRVAQIFWVNAATVAGNTDVGVYDEAGTSKLVSTGSTANSGASAIQIVNVTDYILSPGARYWLAIASDSGTHTYYGEVNAVTIARTTDALGCKSQTSAWSSGLPASATFAAGHEQLPLFGFASLATI